MSLLRADARRLPIADGVVRVAISLGRRAVATELNSSYLALARDRTHVTRGLPLEMMA